MEKKSFSALNFTITVHLLKLMGALNESLVPTEVNNLEEWTSTAFDVLPLLLASEKLSPEIYSSKFYFHLISKQGKRPQNGQIFIQV